ncbi:phosphatidylethanolamine-binding protein 4 isoform X2 [Hyla sarda]|uniref:phosphatidylethanolamine-binding protein 4 isoform X2 n=1 Tax=Hyla sarda TaxID=327740 RepID=UPI0024C2F616|nr:phosphatidylethanolamine-binding protein 4 isoform X2 [Hyla sarda]
MWKALLLLCHLLVVGLFSDIHASCDLQAITGDDAEICSNGFHVEYPNIGDMSCKRVTLCHNVTKDLKVAPVVTYPNAQEGQDILSGEILKGKTIAEYNGPAPPANTGYHRYEFRLYVQPPDSSPALLASEEKVRANFDPDAFASRFSLGKPVAQTQFMAQNLQQKDL